MSRLQHSGLMRAVGDAEVVQELRRIRRKRKNRKSQSKTGKAKRAMVLQLGLENEQLRKANAELQATVDRLRTDALLSVNSLPDLGGTTDCIDLDLFEFEPDAAQ